MKLSILFLALEACAGLAAASSEFTASPKQPPRQQRLLDRPCFQTIKASETASAARQACAALRMHAQLRAAQIHRQRLRRAQPARQPGPQCLSTAASRSDRGSAAPRPLAPRC